MKFVRREPDLRVKGESRVEKIWNVLVFIVAMIVAIGVGLMLYVSGFAGVGFSGGILNFDFHGGNTSGSTILFI